MCCLRPDAQMPIWSGPLQLAPKQDSERWHLIILDLFPPAATQINRRSTTDCPAVHRTVQSQHQPKNSTISPSKKEVGNPLLHTLVHKKKDRVSSAGSRQSQRAGPTRACAAPASNPLGVSSKIVITMKRMQHFGRASSQPCDPAIPVRSTNRLRSTINPDPARCLSAMLVPIHHAWRLGYCNSPCEGSRSAPRKEQTGEGHGVYTSAAYSVGLHKVNYRI